MAVAHRGHRCRAARFRAVDAACDRVHRLPHRIAARTCAQQFRDHHEPDESWRGEYTAQAYAIEVPKNEGAREWGDDDGGELSGKGTLAFTVTASGTIHGSASGALGEHAVVGQVEGDALRIRFVPKAPGDRAFGGVAVLARDGDAMKGRLQGSTGDSKTVRDALISVSREGAGTAQSPAPSSSR